MVAGMAKASIEKCVLQLPHFGMPATIQAKKCLSIKSRCDLKTA
jgi:hypothetical protein